MKLIMGFTELFFLLLPLLSMCTASIKEKVCKGDVIVKSGNIHNFKDCTIIDGYIEIDQWTFNSQWPKMEPSELEVFSTVREMTSLHVYFASHPKFTDLHYFRNLETITGKNHFCSLSITSTSLKSLGLRSLKTIRNYCIVDNMNLCFAKNINWPKVATSKFYSRVINSRPMSQCVGEGMVCNEGCSIDGCWGPSVDECLSCVMISPEKTCLDSCSYPGMYQLDSQTCGKCHEQCNETCTGPDPWNCVKCLKDGPYCSAFKPAENGAINVPAIVGGVLGCTLLIGLIAAVVVYLWRKRAKSREINEKMTMRMSGIEDTLPLKPENNAKNSGGQQTMQA